MPHRTALFRHRSPRRHTFVAPERRGLSGAGGHHRRAIDFAQGGSGDSWTAHRAGGPFDASGISRTRLATLRKLGLTRGKALALKSLASALSNGALDLDAVAGMSDGEAVSMLTGLPGHRSMDGAYLSAERARPGRCLAGRRRCAAGRAHGRLSARATAVALCHGTHRRALAAMARSGGTAACGRTTA